MPTEVIAVLLRWKLCTGFFRDPISKGRCLSLEFARLVLWVDPVVNALLFTGLENWLDLPLNALETSTIHLLPT